MATANHFDAATVSNGFGFQLYNCLRSDRSIDGNIIFSPISITTALAMTFMGAKGETAKQMESVLKLSSQGKEVHHTFKDIIRCDLFQNDPRYRYQLNMENRMFGQKSVNYESDYITSTRDLYGAQIEVVDFVNETECVRENNIIAWVEEQAGGKIEQLIAPSSLSDESCLVLANVIYFKGEWEKNFTYKRRMPFYLSIWRLPEDITMMNFEIRSCKFYHDESLRCKVIVMHYEGQKLNMMIALPDEIDGLEKLEDRLDQDVLAHWDSKMRVVGSCSVTIPKFRFATSFSLVKYLNHMGMCDAFSSEKADFSGIAKTVSPENNLFLSDAIHKIFLEVDTTKAVTSVSFGKVRHSRIPCPHCVSPPPDEVFKADHPFAFFIRDETSGLVVFIGRVMHPLSQ